MELLSNLSNGNFCSIKFKIASLVLNIKPFLLPVALDHQPART